MPSIARMRVPKSRLNGEYLEPQGLQDADSDLLTSDLNTMSSTYVDCVVWPR